LKREDLRVKTAMAEMLIGVSKPLYAALWKSSIWRIQLVNGFHLGQIWATKPSFPRSIGRK
jgi:hypothetical protein